MKTTGLELLQGEKKVGDIYFLGCVKNRNILQSFKELKGNILVLSVFFPTEIQAS